MTAPVHIEPNPMSTEEKSDPIKKLGEMIKDIKFAMLTTVDDGGALRSRPMATQNKEFDGELWFFTKASAPKVDEIEREHHVNVSYSHPEDQNYISVSGHAKLVRDVDKNKELWTAPMKAWFPNGPEDPEVALLKVDVDKAEYWDTPGSAVVHLVGFVKATLTGKPFHPGENEKIEMPA